MSTDCLFCPGTRTCKHRDPSRAQLPPSPDTTQGQIVRPEAFWEAPRAGSSLFVLADLRALRCVLCQTVIPNGRGQANNRLLHGMQHVRDGTAVYSTQGPFPPGAVRFEVMG